MTNSERNETISYISDVYKDVNGIRPRNYNWEAFSDKELAKEYQKLPQNRMNQKLSLE